MAQSHLALLRDAGGARDQPLQVLRAMGTTHRALGELRNAEHRCVLVVSGCDQRAILWPLQIPTLSL